LVGEPLATRIETWLQSLGHTPRLPLIEWRQRRAAPWALFDLVMIGVIALALGEGFRYGGLVPDGKLEELALARKESLIALNAGVSLTIALASVVWLLLRAGARGRDLGASWQTLANDLRLGVIGFVMLAPPVYGLQGLLVMFWKESKHPIVELFKAAPEVRLFVLLLFSAVVIAPLFEELMFRAVLQGFLEKAFAFRGNVVELLIGDSDRQTLPSSAIDPRFPIGNPQLDQPELRGLAAWLPIAISSGIFALLHYSHGPDWVPLLLLAAGMGYLYQRTHSIVPSLVVHALLNAMSMWGLWVTVKEGLRS
jgi:membrane protease YdiL (CAAX protease family)